MLNTILDWGLFIYAMYCFILLIKNVKNKNIKQSFILVILLIFVDNIYCTHLGFIKLIITIFLVIMHINFLKEY